MMISKVNIYDKCVSHSVNINMTLVIFTHLQLQMGEVLNYLNYRQKVKIISKDKFLSNK